LEEIDTDRKLEILDVGIFPWHGLIELSEVEEYVGKYTDRSL